MAATFRVTQSQIVRTAAERRLPSTDSVLTMLKWVERHFSKRLPRQDSINGVSGNVARSLENMKMEMSYPESEKLSPH